MVRVVQQTENEEKITVFSLSICTFKKLHSLFKNDLFLSYRLFECEPCPNPMKNLQVCNERLLFRFEEMSLST